ncbi:hypothetical protein [Glycomyces tenuis]|uniref:hypothetical protein n=1 Tax=Glycomyces tenuis TaxID=58116 RepID=UPI0004205EA0|nr:hypothetical protein [Glycomyces tenuis]
MTDVKQTGKQANQDVKTRARAVKPGHVEVGEFTSGTIGASAPFGRSDFPLPIGSIHYEHPESIPQRILEDERH